MTRSFHAVTSPVPKPAMARAGPTDQIGTATVSPITTRRPATAATTAPARQPRQWASTAMAVPPRVAVPTVTR